MQNRLAMRRGDAGDERRAAMRPSPVVRALAAALAAIAAMSSGLVVAVADPGRGGGRHEHLATVVTPIHGASAAARRGAGAGSRANAPGMLRVLALSSADLSRLLAISGTHSERRLPEIAELGGAPGGALDPDAISLPSTGAPLRTVVTPLRPQRAALPRTGAGAATASALRTPIHQVPDIVLIPPAALPAPAVIRPAHAGIAAGPIVGLVLSVLMLGGLLGLRLARRPG